MAAFATRIVKWLLWSLLALVGIAAVGLVIGYLWLQTPSGRDFVTAQIHGAVAGNPDLDVQVLGLDGNLFKRSTVAKIAVSDKAGPWLIIEDLVLDWSPWSLLGRDLEIHQIQAGNLSVLRTPEPGAPVEDVETPAQSEPFQIPELPVSIQVKQFGVTEINLAEAVAGSPMAFTLAGQLAAPEGQHITSTLSLQALDEKETRVKLDAAYDIGSETLQIAADVRDPADGLLGHLLDLQARHAFAFTLEGEGPVRDWQGHLRVDWGAIADISADLALQVADMPSLTVTAQLASQLANDLSLPPQFTAPVELELQAHLADGQQLALEVLQIKNEAILFNANGSLDLETTTADIKLAADLSDKIEWDAIVPGLSLSDARVTAHLEGGQQDHSLAADIRVGGLAVSGQAAVEAIALDIVSSGPVLQPAADIKLTTGPVQVPGSIALTGSQHDLAILVDSPLDSAAPSVSFTHRTAAERSDSNDPNDPLRVFAKEMALQLAGSFDLTPQILQLTEFSAEAAPAVVTGAGKVNLADGGLDGTVALALADIAQLLGGDGAPVAGTARVTINANATAFGEQFAAEIDGVVMPEFPTPLVAALAGGRTPLSGKLTGDLKNGSLTVERFTVQNSFATVAVNGAIAEAFEQLNFAYRLDVPDLKPLQPHLQQAYSGAVELSGTLTGTLQDLTANGEIAAPRITAAGVEIADLQLTYDAQDLTGQPKGGLYLDAQALGGPLTMQTEFATAADRLTVSDFSFSDGDNRITASAAIPTDSSPITAEARLAVESIQRWLQLAGLEGNVTGVADISLTPNGKEQGGTVKADFKNLTVALAPDQNLEAAAIDVTASLSDLAGAPGLDATLSAKEIAFGPDRVENLTAEVTGDPANLVLQLQSTGDVRGKYDLSAEALLQEKGKTQIVNLRKLAGTLFNQELKLNRQAEITLSPGEFALSGMDLSFGEAQLTADGQMTEAAVTAAFALKDVTLAPYRALLSLPDMDGRFDAAGTVDISRASQEAKITLTGADISLPGFEKQQTANLQIESILQDAVLNVDGNLTGIGEMPATFTLAVPVNIGVSPLAFALPEKAAIDGEVKWQGDIAAVMPLIPVSDHDLHGDTSIDIAISGTTEKPKVNGNVKIDKGRYENLGVGTLLQDLTVDVVLADRLVTIDTFTANDGNGGSLAISGDVTVEPEQDFPVNVMVAASNLHAVRRDDITAEINSEISLNGTAKSSDLKGWVKTGLVEIYIPEGLPPSVVDLQVQEAGSDDGTAASSGNGAAAADSTIRLDIKVDTPGQTFVRGRGLDSEWGGNLHVTGPANKPAVSGHLEVIRGFLGVLGKRFNLDRGKVTFLSGDTIDPELDIRAIGGEGDYQGDFRITGTAGSPEISIGSIPSLPDDEVIAEVFFGKSAAALTPLEALEVAGAIAQLSGKTGSGPGILDKARRLVGVDVLRVDSDAENGESVPSVSAGKYVSENVYVGVKQGAGSQSSAVEVEVELSDHITFSTEARGTGDTEAGIQFQWNY